MRRIELKTRNTVFKYPHATTVWRIVIRMFDIWPYVVASNILPVLLKSDRAEKGNEWPFFSSP